MFASAPSGSGGVGLRVNSVRQGCGLNVRRQKLFFVGSVLNSPVRRELDLRSVPETRGLSEAFRAE